MYYPDAPCCGECIGNDRKNNMGNGCMNYGQKELLDKIREVDFALTDLNLFLDTHPDNKEALELFTKLAATLKSLMFDYNSNYGPLTARSNNDEKYFKWVSSEYKWPWQREGEM